MGRLDLLIRETMDPNYYITHAGRWDTAMGDLGGPTVSVEVENLGGIDHVTETLVPGTNVLAGANATNRTSFLEALATGLGGQEATVKTDAEEGSVRIEIGEETYERRLTAHSAGAQPRIEGEGYLDHPESAELFAWLLADNDIRQALRTDTELRDLAMRPVDTEEIESREADLISERQEIDAELGELEEKAERLPELDAEVQRLESEVDDLEAELEAKREELEAVDQKVAEARQEQSERDDTLEALKDAQNRRASLRQSIDQQKEALEATETELDKKRAALEEAREEFAEIGIDPDRVQAEIRNLQAEQDELRTLKNSLNNIISFNERRLTEDDSELWGLFRANESRGPEQLTEQLGGNPDSEQLECWTCGSRVEVTAVENQLDRLRSQQQALTGQLTDLEEEIEALRDHRRQYESLRERIDSMETEIQELADEAATRQSKIETQEDRLGDVEAEIGELETKLDELEGDEDDVLTLQREVNELEFELEKTQQQLEQAREQRDELETELDHRETLEAKRAEIVAELAEVRNKIDRLETAIVEAFNEHMEALIDVLAYENIARVWLEAKQFDGERDTTFNLHIVRMTEDGRAYEDTVANLSESEREVIAITFALAGYIAHDVQEEMPFLLFDSVEMIDATRLDRLFEYFNDSAEYIVAALLQEDAEELVDDDRTVIDFGGPLAVT